MSVEVDKADHVSIDKIIESIKTLIFKLFTNKWSNHGHLDRLDNCSIAIIIDGIWKIARPKCVYDQIAFFSKEFGLIQTGCRKTPNINSYFCKEHAGKDLIFKTCDGGDWHFIQII